MEPITSRSNRKIVEAAGLKSKKARDESGLFFFEGIKLFQEAIQTRIIPEAVFFSQDCENPESLAALLPESVPRFSVTPAVYEKLTDEKSPQGVFCVAKRLDKLHKSATIYGTNCNLAENLILLESVRDPGNLGTVLRTASAFGVPRLILSRDCADLYNPKTVRAGMGALFRQETVRVDDCVSSVRAMRQAGIRVYAAVPDEQAADIRQIDCSAGGICFAIGNEGHGLSPQLINACDKRVRIPMRPDCESLNAAAAGAVLIWELSGRNLA